MIGGGPYQGSRCPKCGELMWNGRCENIDCDYHWHPLEEDDDNQSMVEKWRCY